MRLNKEKFFIEAISLLCSSMDIPIAINRLRKFLLDYLPVDHVGLIIYEPELKCTRSIVAATETSAEWLDELTPVPEGVVRFIEEELSNKPILINDLVSDERLNTMSEHIAPKIFEVFGNENMSLIGLPLMIEGDWIGSFTVAASGVNRYTESHAELLQPLSEPMALVMSNSLQYREISRLQEMLKEENQYLQGELREVSGHVIGKNFGLKHVMEMAMQTAPKENPVLLFGETGTGKEVIANAIHYSSSRRNGPFVKVNCGAIPENLIDSELFGHEKGAFTGAIDLKKGKFERANGGTIFLDEIGELPLAAQVRLLRVIQNKEIERVGGTATISLNIRIIAATHRDLTQMTVTKEFREDLFYRLNVFPIIVPPLRQRKMDIPELVNYFIECKANETKLKEIPKLALGTIDSLISYDWPGNVRELENVVERALIRYSGGLLTLDDFLAPKVQPVQKAAAIKNEEILPLDEISRRHILKAINHTNGRISGPKGAASLLQMHRNTLKSKMKKLGI